MNGTLVGDDWLIFFGVFLLAGNFVLSIYDHKAESGRNVKHFKITKTKEGKFYVLPNATFNSLGDLVDFFKSKK